MKSQENPFPKKSSFVFWFYSYFHLLTDLRQPDLSFCCFRQSLQTYWSVRLQCSVNPPLNCSLEILLLTYSVSLLSCLM